MQEADQALVQNFVTALHAAIDIELVDQRDEVPFDDEPRQTLDSLLRVQFHGQADVVELAVAVATAVYPRDARRLVNHLSAFNHRRPSAAMPAVPVVVAQHLTGTTRQVLRDATVNYFEATSGTLYFRHGSRLIDIERPSKQPVGRKIGSVFSGAREQVVHALLMHWLRAEEAPWVAGNELAAMAETSAFTVSKTLQELEKDDWVDTTGAGPSQRRRLKKASALLDAWADEWMRRARAEPRTRWYTYAGGRGGIVGRMLEKLASHNGWAMTGAAAANARIPHLTTVDRVLIIVPPGLAQTWAAEFNLERADRGSNITFVERSGASLMFLDEHPERPSSRFASPFVQYLDLLDGVGRNKELANEYRSRVLRMGDNEHD